MNERLAKQIASEHGRGKHKGAPRLDCWACAGWRGLAAPAKRRTSLYPDRELVDCRVCGCEHFKDGRCFAADPAGWPIVRQVTRPVPGFASRMTGAETAKAVKATSEGRRWWAE